jgi:hypothetical protein
MELPARTRLKLRRAAITAALGALLVPATAGAATTHTPTITKVAPKNVAVGQVLTVYGKYFVRGKGKNSVLFRRENGKQLFVKADVSTTKQLKVFIPATLLKYMAVTNGQPAPTRFRLRVLAKRLSRSFTATSKSPFVSPAKQVNGGNGAGAAPPVDGDCDGDGIKNGVDPDADNDGLSNTLELQLKLDPCNPDTDGDGVSDAFEYWSALDLNQGNAAQSIPYPGTKPYPNPLDPSDANRDHDGDVLTLKEEYELWKDPRGGNSQPWPNMGYSDGKQTTVAVPAPHLGDENTPSVIWANDPTMRFLDANHDGAISSTELLALDFNHDGTVDDYEFGYQDLNGDGILSDDERDIDGDGLSNYDEFHGRMTPEYWAEQYLDEVPYTAWVPFAASDPLNADSDGDGIVDGLDDQDDDGFINVQELSRFAAQVTGNRTPAGSPPWRLYGQVNPFNPCLPATSVFDSVLNPGSTFSPDCMRHPPIGAGPAPFDQSSPKYPNYEVTN